MAKFNSLLITTTVVFSLFEMHAYAQEKCGTMDRLNKKFKENRSLRVKFEKRELELQKKLQNRPRVKITGPVTIPVVFHIVMTNPASVTDAQVMAQLDTLNKDFAGTNGDTIMIPSYFKVLLGKSALQFCLSERTPEGETTSGIIRHTTSTNSFTIDDAVKHASHGGADAWNTNQYFNVWICPLSNGILGYATFPDDGSPDEQGVVIDYRSLPGGAYADYNDGKSLTHETGHFFNLYHIWGDDSGACSGTDYVDDTPNQANSTSGCPGGIKTDDCTPSGNGIMYQNYMDYSSDDCLVMFTTKQAQRMEAASTDYRSSLESSNGCTPVVTYIRDAELSAINEPASRICLPSFSPAVTVRNKGSATLASLIVNAVVDDGTPVSITWTGTSASHTSFAVTLPTMTMSPGSHTLTVYTSSPNGVADEDRSNDTLQTTVMYYSNPVLPLHEGFENDIYPAKGWDVVNADNNVAWKRITGIAKTGNASAWINNYEYNSVGQTDYLRLPQVSLVNSDSAFLTFQVAAATYTDVFTPQNSWDTLEVVISKDCGKTYTSLYKKWGQSLITRQAATQASFVPTSSEWRKDSIDLTSFVGQENLMLAFKNTTGYENNIYLDDINLYKVTVNPNLKEKGFLVAPNPTTGTISVQFYPQPKNLKGIVIFSVMGQKIAETKIVPAEASNSYSYDLGRFASGVYIVHVIFTDKVITEKVLKTN
jgi:hypothetical protein